MKKKLIIHFFGLSGAGKTTYSRKIYNLIKKKYKKKVYLLDGDDFRKKTIIKKKLNKLKNPFSSKSRIFVSKLKTTFIKKKISKYDMVLFNSISHSKKVRQYFRKNLKDYFEVFINSNFKLSYKRKLKQIKNFSKNDTCKISLFKKNIIGKDIKFDISRTWDIKINNNKANHINKNIRIIENSLNQKINEKF